MLSRLLHQTDQTREATSSSNPSVLKPSDDDFFYPLFYQMNNRDPQPTTDH